MAVRTVLLVYEGSVVATPYGDQEGSAKRLAKIAEASAPVDNSRASSVRAQDRRRQVVPSNKKGRRSWQPSFTRSVVSLSAVIL